MKKGARAHVLMRPTHNLWNMHRCLVSKHTPNLVTIGRTIPELQLSGQFWHLLRSTRYQLGWVPKWGKFALNKILLNRATTLWRLYGNRMHNCRESAVLSKASLWDRPGKFRTKHRKAKHRNRRILNQKYRLRKIWTDKIANAKNRVVKYQT